MRKVCMSTGWQDCGSNDQAADGVSCAYLTDSEEVVCLPNNFGPCDHKNHQIDGWTTLIKDKSQKDAPASTTAEGSMVAPISN